MRFISNSIIVASLCIRVAFAYTVEETYALAQKQFELGNYQSSIEFFHRVVYFSSDSLKGRALIYLADSYAKINNTGKALLYYDQAYYQSNNASEKNNLIFKKATLLLLQKQPNLALQELFSVDIEINDTINRNRADFFKAIAYWNLKDFDKSRAYFTRLITLQEKLDALFLENQKIDRLKPELARILSMIVPGVGQLYAGAYKEAINSFVLTGLLVFLAYEVTINYSLIDAGVITGPWLFRYYLGGYNNAKKLTEDRIAKRRAEVYSNILSLLEVEK